MILIEEGSTFQSASDCKKRLSIADDDFTAFLESGLLEGSRKRALRWRYVGFISTRADLIVGLPKVPLSPRSRFRLLRRVLQRFFADSKMRASNAPDAELLFWKDGDTFKAFDATVSLLRLFLEDGPYMTTVRDRARTGKLDWRQTLREQAFVTQLGPFYPTLRFKRDMQRANDVTRVQLGFLSALLDRFSILSRPASLPDAIRRFGAFSESDLEAQREAISKLLHKERSITYRTNLIDLIDLLLALIGQFERLRGPVALRMYGTTSFELVWEAACRALFDDDSNVRTELAQPTWAFLHPPIAFDGHPQRPDILIRCPEETAVIDAKYYFPVPETVPGWGDIAKQLVYAQSVLAPAAGHVVSNSFIFPAADTTPILKRIGKVSVAHKVKTIGSIAAYSLAFEHALTSYAAGSGEHCSLRNDFFSADDDRQKLFANPEV